MADTSGQNTRRRGRSPERVRLPTWTAVVFVVAGLAVWTRSPRPMIAEWVLQPGFELTEDTTEIPISVNVPFGIGEPNGERTLFGPFVFETDDTVRVIVVLLDFPNDGMAGLIVDGLPVRLDRPLGDREVEGASPTLADKADIYAEPMG